MAPPRAATRACGQGGGRNGPRQQASSSLAAVAVAVAFLAPTGASAVVPATGSVECPCIAGTDGDYGIGCKAHDLTGGSKSACVGANLAEWCYDEWCYVEPSNCTVQMYASQIETGKWYSYPTCGYLDNYTDTLPDRSLANNDLRVLYLSNSGGWKGNYCGTGSPVRCTSNTGSGPLQKFLDDLATLEGFRLVQPAEWPPPAAVERQKSELNENMNIFEECTIATGMGFLDVCIGSFVMTPERVQRSHFILLQEEPVYLIVPFVDKLKPVHEYMLDSFRPLSAVTWAVVVSSVLALSFLIALMELAPGGEFHQQRRCRVFFFAIYKGLLSIVSGRSAFRPMTKGGSTASLGLSILTVVTLIGYIANLTTYFVLQKIDAPSIHSLRDVMDGGLTMCASTGDIPALTGTGFPASQILEKRARSLVFAAIGIECDAAVIRLEDLEAAQAGGEACEIHRVGDPVYTLRTGFPVSSLKSRALANSVQQALYAGKWDATLAQFREPPTCTINNGGATEEDFPTPLKLERFSGPLAVAAAAAFLATIMHFGSRAAPHESHSSGERHYPREDHRSEVMNISTSVVSERSTSLAPRPSVSRRGATSSHKESRNMRDEDSGFAGSTDPAELLGATKGVRSHEGTSKALTDEQLENFEKHVQDLQYNVECLSQNGYG